MAPVVADAVVLRTYPYGDSSLIVRVLTADQGLLSLIAKGVRRQRKSSGVLLESFVTGEALIYPSRGGDLHTLGRFSASRARQTIGSDLGSFSGASLLVEIVLRTATAEPSGDLYSTLESALDALARPGVDSLSVTVTAGWQLLTVLGFAPETGRCLGCGREVGHSEATAFDPQGGGIMCTGCRPGRRLVSGSIRALLRAASGGAWQDPAQHILVAGDRIAYRDLFLTYLRHQVEDGGQEFKSISMVRVTLK